MTQDLQQAPTPELAPVRVPLGWGCPHCRRLAKPFGLALHNEQLRATYARIDQEGSVAVTWGGTLDPETGEWDDDGFGHDGNDSDSYTVERYRCCGCKESFTTPAAIFVAGSEASCPREDRDGSMTHAPRAWRPAAESATLALMETARERLLAIYRTKEGPTLTASELGRRLGVTRQRVQELAKAEGLELATYTRSSQPLTELSGTEARARRALETLRAVIREARVAERALVRQLKRAK